MERVLYVVARENPLLVGYLMTRTAARSSGGPLVDIKLDERRGERRLASEARDPDRRSRDRRLRPSLDRDLRSRGYATVRQSGVSPPRPGEPEPAPAMAWQPRSTWERRAVRAGRRRYVLWGSIVMLLAAAGVSIVVARSVRWTPVAPPPDPQVAPQVAPQVEEALPPPPASKAETVVPAAPPLPPAKPAPIRIVSMRSAGVVLSVDSKAGTLVLEDWGAADATGRRRVEVAPDARVLLSERDEQAGDLKYPFKDTVISLSEIRRGDYVVVELQGPEGKELARSVVVTLRR
ncbi:MAG: hypothetical protein WEG40_13420 [Candidatus Rokuibacteriota bacterium]